MATEVPCAETSTIHVILYDETDTPLCEGDMTNGGVCQWTGGGVPICGDGGYFDEAKYDGVTYTAWYVRYKTATYPSGLMFGRSSVDSANLPLGVYNESLEGLPPGWYVVVSVPASPAPDPPGTPTGLTATTLQYAHIPVSWDAVAGADAYRLYESGDGYTTPIYDGASTSFDDTGLGDAVTKTYKVSAYNTGGESALSGTASATTLSAPSTPAGLAATGGLISYIPLTWTAATRATAYRVYRSTDSYTAAIYDGAGTSFSDTGLADNTLYGYKVVAYNAAGASAKSTAVTATTGTAVVASVPGFERPDCLSFIPLMMTLDLI